MASPSATIYTPEDDSSDYGSDFSPEEEALAERLIAVATLQERPPIQDIEDIAGYSHRRNGSNHSRRQSANGWETHYPVLEALRAACSPEPMDVTMGVNIDAAASPTTMAEPKLTSATTNVNRVRDPIIPDPNFLENFLAANEKEAEVTESPLQRFRSNINKQALSVTDLISTSWCELQYFYQLRTGRRKKATAAMKKGTKVHKALEEEISKPIVVTTVTREDGWGLRIWNVIQGLKTLRETGLSRELEVWGIIDGQVVNGVIDEVSYKCPDEEMEYDLGLHLADFHPPVQNNQKTISQYFQVSGNASLKSAMGGRSNSFAANATNSEPAEDSKRIYITDIKTRGGSSLPNDASFRPTKMQLMLYHRLLHKLCTNTVDFPLVASRYNLDITVPFSDSFIAEMAGIQDSPSSPNFSDDNSDIPPPPPSETEEDALTTLLAHNNLSLLWTLMISEFLKTFPHGRKSLGNILQAEYRTPATTAEGGRVIGSKTFPMSDYVLDVYLEYEMRWWRGEREPVGVVVAEAWKCGYCDFAAGCEWRREREGEFRVAVEERKERARIRRVERAGGVEGGEVENARVEVKVDGDGSSDVEITSDGEMKEKKEKKRRGRPKKVESTESIANSANIDINTNTDTNENEILPEKLKKKRGRPRKVVQTTDADDLLISEDTNGIEGGSSVEKMGGKKGRKKRDKGVLDGDGNSDGILDGKSDGKSDEEWERVQLDLMVKEAEAEAER